jgi:HSP20 family protein
MDTRTIWHPWHEMHRLQREMDQLFGQLAPAWRWPLTTSEYPPVNIVRADGTLILEAMCPGVERDSFDVTVVGDTVTLRCERKPPADVPPERYHRRERPMGTFTRTIAMGERCDPDRTQATYKNGMLRVELAGAPESTPKKLQIQG